MARVNCPAPSKRPIRRSVKNMFKLLFVLPVIAFVDPFLLYWMWPHLNFSVQLAALIIFPLVVTILLRSKPISEGELFVRPIRFGTRVAAWYPGPISKVLSLLLIVPAIERGVIRWATDQFQQHILRGIAPASNGTPGAKTKADSFSAAPRPGDDNLKRARGRVVE